MQKPVVLLIALSLTFFSCKKNLGGNSENGFDGSDANGIFGRWQWTGSQAVLLFDVTPSPDSVVTLTLWANGSYDAAINGNVLMKGAFSIIYQSHNDTALHFDNFPQSTTSGGLTQIGTYDIGRLTLFKDELLSTYNDTLQLISDPLTPEPYLSYFKR